MSSIGPSVCGGAVARRPVQREDDQQAGGDAGQVGAEQVAEHQPLRVRQQHHHRHRRQQRRREHRQQREEEDAAEVAHAAILTGTIGHEAAGQPDHPRRRRPRARPRLLRSARLDAPAPSPATTSSSSRPATWSLALWDRARLAEDSCVEDSPGWGGVTLALNLGSPAEVDAAIEEARARRARRSAASPPRPSGAATAASSSTPTATPGRSPTTRTGSSTEDGGVRLN